MPTDLKERPDAEAEDDANNPGQRHSDEVFNRLTSDSHMAKDGKPGDVSGGKKGKDGDEASAADKAKGTADGLAKGFQAGVGAATASTPVGRAAKVAQFFWKTKRRRQATVGGGIGGLLIALFMLFITTIIPLKINGLVTNLETRFGAATEQAAKKTTTELFDHWVTSKIMPNVANKPKCKTLVTAGCVSKASGNGPISRLYNSWREGRLEKRMAEKYGFQLARNGNVWYLSLNGEKFNIGDGSSVFGDDAHSGNERKIRALLSKHLDDLTRREKMSYRFLVAPYVRAKYGIRHCWNACKQTDNVFKDSARVKARAAFAQTTHRVIEPLSSNWALILQCVLTGSCSTDLDNAESGDIDRKSGFSKELEGNLLRYAAKYGTEALEDLVKTADRIAKEGFTKYFATQLFEKLATSLLGKTSGQLVSAGLSDLAGPIGLIIFLTRAVVTVEEIAPLLRQAIYYSLTAAAVTQFTEYQTVGEEQKAGQMDLTQLGGYINGISTNINPYEPGDPGYDPEVANNISDAAQTPLYSAVFPSESASPISRTDAAKKVASGSPQYVCPEDDGKPVPSGDLLCQNEVFARGVGFFDWINKYGYVGFTSGLRDFVRTIFNWFDSFIGGIIGWALKPFIAAFSTICNATPACKSGLEYMLQHAGEVGQWLWNKILQSPFSTNMSGGRTGDMIIGGADSFYNTNVCQGVYGCSVVDDQTAFKIQEDALQQKQKEFGQRPFFARMFDTDTPYSFVSRVAMQMPSNFSLMLQNIANTLIRDPFALISNGFASVLHPQPALAAVGNLTQDPFGIPQTAFPDNQIPSADELEKVWDEKCAEDYDPVTGELEIVDWLNSQEQDEATGLAIATEPNVCLLILRAAQSAGGLFDESLIPPPPTITVGDNETPTTPTDNGSLPTGSAQELAKQLMVYVNNGKVKCAFQVNCRDIRYTASGTSIKSASCRVDALNKTIVGMMLKLAQMGHTFILSSLCSDHAFTTYSQHPWGRAVDFNTIDGVFMGAAGAYGQWTSSLLTAGKNLDRDIVSFMPKDGTQFGQVNCHPTFDFFSGYTTFNDTCHHQHVHYIN